MKKLLILLTIPLFLFLNTNFTSASTSYSLDIIDNYLPDNTILQNEDYQAGYQDGYRQGYEEGFSHDNRVKIALWKYEDIRLSVLDTVYRFQFNNFVPRNGIFSPAGLSSIEIRNKVFIPSFRGHISDFGANIRQWYLTVNYLYLSVEKSIIDDIMVRDNVNEINALRTYLEENNIYGYFERADGKTKYQLGYESGYKDAMKETTTKLMSSVLLLVSPILLISIILQMLNKFKNDN